MQPEAIELLILQEFPQAKVQVTGDGYHFEARIIAKEFEALSKVKQQQMVYKVLAEHIASGDLHAISLKTYSISEWEKVKPA